FWPSSCESMLMTIPQDFRSGEIDRRTFLLSAGAVAGAAVAQMPMVVQAAEQPVSSNNSRSEKGKPKMIGIQVGAVSFVDEGVDPVLDVFQEKGRVDTLFLATFTYGRGIAGRQVPGQPLPDHGKQEYDEKTFHGGNYATSHSQFYERT